MQEECTTSVENTAVELSQAVAQLDRSRPQIVVDREGGDAVLIEGSFELWQTTSAAELRRLSAEAAAAARWLEGMTTPA